MAQKRMFNKTITNNDNFLEMPMSSQVLYFHLSMNADDDGFVDNWKSIMRMIGTKDDDLKVLIAKNYIIPFESGVIVIKHWRLNNYLQKDRIVPTQYQEELKQLQLNNNNVYEMYTKCIHSIDKYSIEENSIDKNSKENIYGEFQNVKLSEAEYKKLENKNLLSYIEKLSCYLKNNPKKKYASHYATILNWSRREDKKESKKEDIIPDWFNKDLSNPDLATASEMNKLIEEIQNE